MIKNISNLGDAALYCDFGSEVNKDINSKVIRYFKTIQKENIAILNLDKIQSLINKKTINTNDILNSSSLKKLKLINKNSKKLKILGSGEIKDKINIEADLASKSALEKLEKIGGSIQLKK